MKNNVRRIQTVLFVGCIVISALLLLLYSFIEGVRPYLGKNSVRKLYPKPSTLEKQRKPNFLKTVVIYQPREMIGYVPSGNSVFVRSNCAVKNCLLTTSELYKSSADVILFGENTVWEPPKHRPLHQIWIIRILESPENTKSLSSYDNQVNFTAAYHPKSDLPIPYGFFISNNNKLNISSTTDYSKGKSRYVAWYVSHCLTNNHRMNYALELSKHIQVDIYGECGGFYLEKENGYLMLRKQYKFYLAFENSNCRHYITEKFWNNALE